MTSNLTRSRGSTLKISAFVWIALVCINVVVTKGCDNRPDRDEVFQKSGCIGNVVAVHSVWTEIQCLDNCLRHPRCDKYIFNGPENQTCELLNTVDIAGVVNLPQTAGECAPSNITVVRRFLLGTKRCDGAKKNNKAKTEDT